MTTILIIIAVNLLVKYGTFNSDQMVKDVTKKTGYTVGYIQGKVDKYKERS